MSRAARAGLRADRGFTLVELLAVLAIAAIVAGLVVVASGKVRDSARKSRARTEVERIKSAVEEHLLRKGALPDSLDQIDWPTNCRLSFSNRCPVDPWGDCYVYTNNGPRAYVVRFTRDNRAP